MPKKKTKILVVEDETFLRNFWENKLDPLNYEVLKAADGKKGLRLAQKEKPNLILLDIIMPDIDGFEVLKKLKEDKKTKKIPVIILSNLGQDEEIRKGLKLGAKGFIVKSDVIPDEVEEKIIKILKNNKSKNTKTKK